MRVVMLVQGEPPHEGSAGEVEFANALHRLEDWLKREYPEWGFATEFFVGYADSQQEAATLLQDAAKRFY